MKPNRLAVIIPLYNHEQFIRKGIESALGQTLPPDRVIVLDDGSKDGSVEAARSVNDPRVEVHTQENRGAHNTLNRLVEMAADCDFVSILNSDDFYDRTRFEKCMAELEAHPTASLVCTGVRLVGADGGPVPEADHKNKWFNAIRSLFPLELPLPEKLGIANFLITTSNFVARREWLLANPLRDYRYVHDYYALAWAALEDKLRVIPDTLLSYRTHQSNTISTQAANLVREMLRMNFDLASAAGEALHTNPQIGLRWSAYLSMTWVNICNSRGDLFSQLLARAAAHVPEGERQSMIADLEKQQPGAFHNWPNKDVYATFTGGGTLLDNPGLPARHQQLTDAHESLKEEASAIKQMHGMRTEALGSRWYALGLLLGLGPKLHRPPTGKGGSAKLASLRGKANASAWLKLGATLGIQSARRILDASRSTK